MTPEQKRDQKLKSDHIRSVRSIFRNIGFERASEIAEKSINFLSQDGEFDDCFISENLIVLAEYTTSSSSKISDHIKHKKIIFDRVNENQEDFLNISASIFHYSMREFKTNIIRIDTKSK